MLIGLVTLIMVWISLSLCFGNPRYNRLIGWPHTFTDRSSITLGVNSFDGNYVSCRVFSAPAKRGAAIVDASSWMSDGTVVN